MGEVVWLSSYPKSGNTWVRALLAGYFGEGAFDVNRLGRGIEVDGLRSFSDVVGIDPWLLHEREVEAFRPAAARVLARDVAHWETPAFAKIHAANVVTASGERAFPPGAGRALYVVRNPLDVAASWAPFFGVSVERAVEVLGDEAHTLNQSGEGFNPIVPERLLSWSGHVRSWLDAEGVPSHVVRYEDLREDTASTFAAALRWLGLEAAPGRVEAAVEAARFERLRGREAAEGFVEHPVYMARAPFFRRGRAGAWRDELTAAQARRVVAAHRDVMERLGYGALVAEVEALP